MFVGAYPGAYSHNAYTSVSGLGGNGYPGSYPYRRVGGYGGYNNGYNSGYNSGYYNQGLNTGYLGGVGGTTYPYGGVGYTAGAVGGYY